MFVYIFLIISVILLGLITKPRNRVLVGVNSQYSPDKSTNRYLYYISFLFIMIAALRADIIGLDTEGYKMTFQYYFNGKSFANIWNNERYEPFFAIICVIGKWLGGFFYLKLFVVFVNVFFIFRAVNRYSSLVWLSCLLFFLFAMYRSNFNEMRQAVALGISYFGFIYIIDKKFWKYLIVVAVAYMFHRSSLILLPLYFFCQWDKIKGWHFLMIAGACTFMFAISLTFIDLINYIGRNEYTANTETGGWFLFALQIMTVALAFLVKDTLNLSRANVCCFFMVASTVIIFPICHLNPTFFRMEFYAWSYMIIFVPNMIQQFNGSFIRYGAIFAYIAVGLYSAFTITYIENTQLVPYKFFWE